MKTMTQREYYTGLFTKANAEAKKKGLEALDFDKFIMNAPLSRGSMDTELGEEERDIVDRMIKSDGYYEAMKQLDKSAAASAKYGFSIRALAVSRLTERDVQILDSRLKINGVPEEFMNMQLDLSSLALVIALLIKTADADAFIERVVQLAADSVKLTERLRPHLDLHAAIKTQNAHNN